MVGVDGVVERERRVAKAPVVTGALLLVNDESFEANSLELGSESESVVTTTD